MFARVTTGQMLVDKVEEAIGIYQNSVVPACQQQKGFKGLSVLTDRNTGKGLIITVWETEADMLAGEANGHYRQQVAKFKDIVAAQPMMEAYEVVVAVQPSETTAHV